jgi:hypothetical protein
MDCDDQVDDDRDDEYVPPERGADLHRLRRERRRLQQLQSERRQDILARSSPSAQSQAAVSAAVPASESTLALPEHPAFSSRFVWDGGADWQPSPWSKVMTSMADTFNPAKPEVRILKTIPPFFHVGEMEARGLALQLLPYSQRLSTEVLKEEVLCWESATRALTDRGYITPGFLLKVHASLTVMWQMYGYYGDDHITDDEKEDSKQCDERRDTTSEAAAAAPIAMPHFLAFSQAAPRIEPLRAPSLPTTQSDSASPSIPPCSCMTPDSSSSSSSSSSSPSSSLLTSHTDNRVVTPTPRGVCS